MELIGQGIVSNQQFNSSITPLVFVAFSLHNYQYTFLIRKNYIFLEFYNVISQFALHEIIETTVQYQT